MIVTVNWEAFHMLYFNQNTIYVLETDELYHFWTHQGIFFVKSTYMKKEDQEENMMFVERYLTGRSNIIKAINIQPKEDIAPISPDSPSDEQEEFPEELFEEVQEATEGEELVKQEVEAKNDAE